MTVDELRRLKPPFMVFWELNHFLVVEGFVGRRVYLSDPASGRRSINEQSFRHSYTGVVFSFKPGPGFRKGGDKPTTGKAILRRMRGLRAAVAYVVLAGLAVMACELIAASYNLIFVDQILIENRWSWIRPLLFIMGLTAVLHALVAVIQRRSLRELKLSVAVVYSSKFLWHVLRLPITFYQQRYAGDISSRVESNSVVADLISGQLATTMVGLLMVVFYAAVTLAFNPLLTVVGVAIGCLNLAGIALASRLLAEESLKIRHDRGKLFGSMMWAVQIIETIKAGASEHETLARLTGHQTRMTNGLQRIGVANALLIAMPPLLSLATTAAILWIGGARVIDGVMSVGALVAMQTLMANLNRPFGDLVRLGSSVQALQAELARLDDVHQFPLDPRFETAAAPSAASSCTAVPGRPALTLVEPKDSPRRLRGHLELRNVTFGYRRAIDQPLISDFSLEIQPGSRVALVGISGSGKSTIGRLATGLYRPWSGEVLYDGMRIDEIPREVFTDQVAVVDDQTFLFSGTIRNNLTLWDQTIAERDMCQAGIDAVIHRDLIGRRGGYHAKLAEAARNFSGGQRQRLEIARALIRNPALLVLDEATSALDNRTQALVSRNIQSRLKGTSRLVIAHRLSTIVKADRIYVLSQGKIVQSGTYSQLIHEPGPFQELARRKMLG
jgi:NHLM bacteriocin system ABC transporter peptidase/ATP-binding protein